MAKSLIGLAIATVSLVGCANGPCRPLRHPELAGQSPAATAPADAVTPAANTGVRTDAKPSGSMTQESTALVYKADGSLQCNKAKGLSAEEMEKQLGAIKVFSRDKRSDGLMHIQVCGSPTGQINVFEIPVSSLKDAEAKGFKKLDHR